MLGEGQIHAQKISVRPVVQPGPELRGRCTRSDRSLRGSDGSHRIDGSDRSHGSDGSDRAYWFYGSHRCYGIGRYGCYRPHGTFGWSDWRDGRYGLHRRCGSNRRYGINRTHGGDRHRCGGSNWTNRFRWRYGRYRPDGSEHRGSVRI